MVGIAVEHEDAVIQAWEPLAPNVARQIYLRSWNLCDEQGRHEEVSASEADGQFDESHLAHNLRDEGARQGVRALVQEHCNNSPVLVCE